MVEGGASRDDIRLAPHPPEKLWDRMEWYHKTFAALGAMAAFIFGAGAGFQRIKTAVVLADTQHATDDRQDQEIRAVQDDSGRLHVTMDDLHDEVRGMRTDLRFFDPRMRGGGLPELPAETPRPISTPTPPRDPSIGLPVPTPTVKP